MKAPTRLLPIVATLTALGCGGPADLGQLTTTVSDSAGVLLVRTSGADHMLPVRAFTRIGVRDGDPAYQFHLVHHMAVDSLGHVWVVDSGETVREYDRSGQYVGSYGGMGQGPGESPAGYGRVWVSDGLVVLWAANNTGLQLFSRDGEYIGTRSVDLGPDLSFLQPLSPIGDRWTFKIESSVHMSATEGALEWTVVHGELTSTILDTVLVRRGPKSRAPPQSHGYSLAPYVEGRPDLGGDGRGDVFYSDPLRYRVEAYDSLGTLARVLTRNLPPVVMPNVLEGDVRAGIERALQGEDGGAVDRRRVEDLMSRALPIDSPDHLPFIASLLVSADGSLWVERADQFPNPAMRLVADAFGYGRSTWREEWRSDSQFDLFESDGSYVGSVILPSDFLPMVAAGSRVFGTQMDEFDVQYVVGYQVGGS